MQSFPFSETRTVSGTTLIPDSHFFFSGPGHERVLINDGQPDVLNAIRSSRTVSGRIFGNVKVVAIKGTNDWYSLRSVGRDGNKKTVYVTGATLIVVDGVETDLATLYRENA
jgi:hypothetical protein